MVPSQDLLQPRIPFSATRCSPASHPCFSFVRSTSVSSGSLVQSSPPCSAACRAFLAPPLSILPWQAERLRDARARPPIPLVGVPVVQDGILSQRGTPDSPRVDLAENLDGSRGSPRTG